MTGAVATLRGRPLRERRLDVPAQSLSLRRLGIELVAFAGLAGLVLLQWGRLVAHAPGGRMLAALVVACAAAALLALLGRARLPRPVTLVAALAFAAGAVAVALLAAGVPVRLLAPAHWGELRDNLSFGFSGVEQADLPYRGEDQWLQRALLCVAPVLIAVAAAVAFWPGRDAARATPRRRMVSLLILVAGYGVAVTLDSPGAELLWGLVLLALIALWLWAPRIAAASAGPATAVVIAAGALALPAAAALDPDSPWWDYENWSWFGSEREVTFEWDHRYGPLDWPQEGTTLFEVQATRPLYWKAAVLDRFDGFTWQRARDSDIYAVHEQAARRAVPGQKLPDRNDKWLRQATFEVRALSSSFVVGAGTTQGVQGVEGASASADGTVQKFGSPIEAGDEYTIVSYVPDPTVEELRAAPRRYPPRLRQQVLLGLPTPGNSSASATDGGVALGSADPVEGRPMALWGTENPAAAAAAEASAYGGVYKLARRLTSGAPTPYDAVIRIQRYLHRNYIYNPDVPRAAYPLDAFLFGRREGYCQQFAGSMALMLRMIGIPTRVVAGFAPGTFDDDRDIYTVRDTDAHSWVEVYFRGIGWVTFDPTPSAAPAVSQSLNELAAFRSVAPVNPEARVRDRQRRDRASASTTQQAAPGDDGLPWGAIGLVIAAAALVGAMTLAFGSWRRRRAMAAGGAADAQLAELLEALRRLGWGLPPRATLLAVEQRFRSAGRPAVAGYAAALRKHRFARGGPPPPGLSARRALRRALAGGGGIARWLRGMSAIPPGGPRHRPGS